MAEREENQTNDVDYLRAFIGELRDVNQKLQCEVTAHEAEIVRLNEALDNAERARQAGWNEANAYRRKLTAIKKTVENMKTSGGMTVRDAVSILRLLDPEEG
jgi:chromosome segregation ATPase